MRALLIRAVKSMPKGLVKTPRTIWEALAQIIIDDNKQHKTPEK